MTALPTADRTPNGWIAAGGRAWRPRRPGEPHRFGDRWLRVSAAGACAWCRPMGAVLRAAFAALDQGPDARRAWGCNAVPLLPETQRGPYPPPLYQRDLRPGLRGTTALLPRTADLVARGAPPIPAVEAAEAEAAAVLRRERAGPVLAARRRALGLSQRDAAAASGMSRGAIAHLEIDRPLAGVVPSRERYAGLLAQLEARR